MKKLNPLIFATLVWLASALSTPLILFAINPTPNGAGLLGGVGQVIFLMIIYGLVLSIPNWLLLIFATWKINKKEHLDTRQKKILLIKIGVVLTVSIFFLVNLFSGIISFSMLTVIPYTLTITLGIWIFPLQFFSKKIKRYENILDDVY